MLFSSKSSLVWDVKQRRMVFSYGRFRTTCWSHHQESSSSSRTPWHINIGPIGFPETSVSINPRCVTFKKRDDSFRPLRSLKSNVVQIICCSQQACGLVSFRDAQTSGTRMFVTHNRASFSSSWINYFCLKFRNACEPSASQLCSCVHFALLSTTVAETLHTCTPASLSCPRAESMVQCVTNHEPLRNDLRYVGHIDGHISSS